jgi:hypothetical protein
MAEFSNFELSTSEGVEDSYVAGVVSVSTSQVEAKVGGSPLTGREVLRIFNNSNTTIYFGPSGLTASTGEPIYKNQWVEIKAKDSLSVYLLTASGTASDVRIQEMA